MGDIAPDIDRAAVATTELEFDQPGEAADGSDTFVIDNETLVAAIEKARQIAKDLQHRSIDNKDPALALRAHEVQAIGKSLLEKLLIAQGGQDALDELNSRERAGQPAGTKTVWPHH